MVDLKQQLNAIDYFGVVATTIQQCSLSTEWVHANVREHLHTLSELWHFHYHYDCIALQVEILRIDRRESSHPSTSFRTSRKNREGTD
nr:unnamed protein product [Haemonchus contortus]